MPARKLYSLFVLNLMLALGCVDQSKCVPGCRSLPDHDPLQAPGPRKVTSSGRSRGASPARAIALTSS